MPPTHRKQLLAIMANIEQQMVEAEKLIVDVPDDEILLGASEQLAEDHYLIATTHHILMVIACELQKCGARQ